jgi:uncharacterized protein (TIGR02145 family)
MKKHFFFLSVITMLCINGWTQVSQFPQVYYDGQGAGGANLNIRQSASYGSSVLDLLYVTSKIGAASLVTNSNDTYFYNWVKVCLPTTTTIGSIAYGYMACGEFYARINESNSYATVTASPYLNIRPTAGSTTQWVTIGGVNSCFGQNSIVALTGNTSNISGVIWYEVHLTMNCSQYTGWLSGAYLSIASPQSYYNIGGRVCDNAGNCAFLGNINGAHITLGSIGSTYSSSDFYQYKLPVGWSGNITCTHPNYNTSTPAVYNYTATGNDYTKQFVLSNNSGPSAPTATTNPATNITSTSAILNGTVNANNSSATVTFEYGLTSGYGSTMSGIPNTVTGNSNTSVSANISGLTTNTLYHFRVKAVNSYGTTYGSDLTFTTTGGGSLPIATTNPATNIASTSATLNGTVNANNYSTTVTFEYGLTSGYGSTVPGTPNTVTGTTNTSVIANISGLTINTLYHFRVKAVNSYGTTYGNDLTFITSASTTTIAVNSATVQPWQRANEASVIVSANCITSDGTQWRFKAYNPISTSTIFSSFFNSNSGTHSWTLPVSFYPYPTEPQQISYSVVSSSGGSTPLDSYGKTTIIESQWWTKNVVYYNTSGRQIKIPLKYLSNTSSVNIVFVRDNFRSQTCPFGWAISSSDNISQAQQSGNQTPYYIINYPNLMNVTPGQFMFQISYYGTGYYETGYIDLTKIGRLNSSNVNSNRILVGIAGIFNNMEQDFKTLDNNATTSWLRNSDLPFSIASFITYQLDCNTWYIAQGNTNYIKSNAYNLGIALDSITSICQRQFGGANEIDIICHSKGGLETRALLGSNNSIVSNLTQSISGESFNLQTSNWYSASLIKKVVFLDVPHKGALIECLPIHFQQYSPAREDLKPFSSVINYLNGGAVSIPSGIQCLNLTGFYSKIFLTDGAVLLVESEKPYLGQPYIQLYQNTTEFIYNPFNNPFGLNVLHSQIYKNNILSNDGECTSLFNTNIDKINDFLRGYPAVSSCVRDDIFIFSSFTSASILPNAKIYFKTATDSIYNLIGATDENGNLNFSQLGNFSINDSLKIEATGKETVIFSIDSSIINSHSFNIATLSSNMPINKIQYPSLKLVNQNQITANSTINIEATGQNVVSYEINSPFNQDSIFVSLSLINNQFTSQLDTGNNVILVRFIGMQDTVRLTKVVYYWPNSLMNQNTYNVVITANTMSIGAKIYVNNQFIKQINASIDTIPVLRGQNSFKFLKFGYSDSLVTIDSAATINISSHLFPHSYSSLTDSSIVDFPAHGKIQYRKNVTIMDSARQSIISIKQYDDSYSWMGLIPKSRKFEIRHLNSNWSGIRFAAVLDQIENLSSDSIYLMRIYNGTSFTKIPFDPNGTVAGYDSTVQKLNYNFINFNNGTATKEALVIMKKQAPIVNNVSMLTVNEHDTLKVALSYFFSDPDSIHNDMNFQVGYSPSQLNIQIINDSVLIFPSTCWSGYNSFTLQAQHDGLWRSISDSIHIISSIVPTITASGSTIFCQNDSVILTSSSANSYSWSNGATTQSITVLSSGNYAVTITNTDGCSATSSNKTVTVNPNLLVNVSISVSANPICGAGSSVTFTANPANGGTPSYQWYRNAVPVGTGQPLYTYVPANGDLVSCILTSSEVCTLNNPASSNTISMIIANPPVVTFTSCFDTVTILNAQPIVLKGGIPLGGTYSGMGVNSGTGVFTPSIAGIGTKTITYSYTNVSLCSASKTKTIIIQSAPAFTCGNNLIDLRDNKEYPTVQIGSQCWMAANLNYGTMLISSLHQSDNCIPEKYCNNDLATNCQLGSIYYQWDEIMQYDDTPGLKGLCPPGWHIPTEAEWDTLFTNWTNNGYAGSYLKYSGSSGFNALLSGVKHFNRQWDFHDFATFFWSSTANGPFTAWAHGMNDYNPGVSLYPSSRVNAFSVRCLHDD